MFAEYWETTLSDPFADIKSEQPSPPIRMLLSEIHRHILRCRAHEATGPSRFRTPRPSGYMDREGRGTFPLPTADIAARRPETFLRGSAYAGLHTLYLVKRQMAGYLEESCSSGFGAAFSTSAIISRRFFGSVILVKALISRRVSKSSRLKVIASSTGNKKAILVKLNGLRFNLKVVRRIFTARTVQALSPKA